MATKRLLYKPAQTNVGKKGNRRPLAQGRLVTAASQSAPSGPRLVQGEASDTLPQASLRSRVEDPNATPRKSVPHAMQHLSAAPSPPAPTLDLSDSEDDEVTFAVTPGRMRSQPVESRVPVHHHPHVMVLDASACSQAFDRADIDCVVGYERSPATVVCHKQSPRGSTTPQRRPEETVWQVQVDQVPRAAAISPLSQAVDDDDTRENQHAGDARTEGVMDTRLHHASHGKSKPRSARLDGSAPKMPQPNFDDSDETDREKQGREVRGKKAAKVPPEAVSDSDTCSLFEYVPQVKSRPQTTESTKKRPAPKAEKKKKGERFVPSRYMQSAVSRKAGNISAAFEKNSWSKRNLTQGSSYNSSGGPSFGKKTPSRPSTAKKTPSRSQAAPQNASGSSPETVQGPVPQGKTSTPTHDGVPVMHSCDASAINPELSMLSALDATHLRAGSGSGHLAGLGSSKKPTKKEDPRLQQQRLDLIYARYMQWLFLDTRASKMLHQQEKEAMVQLSAVWELVESKRKEKAELEQEVAKLRHLNMVDSQLETQEKALEPVARLLPSLQKNYCGLSAALDTTRHQIHTAGVHIPDDEDFFQASLEQVLGESEQLLGSLAQMTRSQAPAVGHLADAVGVVERALEAECSELYRCGELLSAVQSVATHESSLRIQAMQANR